MAKKIKKFSSDIAPRRGMEKMQRAGKLFSRAVLMYIFLVACAVFLGSLGEYDLGGPSINGFPLCFLLLPAYLPLLVVGWLGLLFGVPVTVHPGQEAVWLGVCDILLVTNVWWIIKLIASRRQSPSILRTARVFVLIVVVWGIFQIGCSAVLVLWRKSGFTVLHSHLERPDEAGGEGGDSGDSAASGAASDAGQASRPH